jgi:hypothetical protein
LRSSTLPSEAIVRNNFLILHVKTIIFLQAPDARTMVWRERQRQNGNNSTSQYGTYYGRPSFESADETLDES